MKDIIWELYKKKEKKWGKFKVDIFKKENDNETKKHRILNTRFNETFMGAKAAAAEEKNKIKINKEDDDNEKVG